MDKLSTETIEARLADHPDWVPAGDVLQRTFGFDDFVGAMAFVNRVADIAESQQHHPDIMIRYNKVTLSVSTHDAGGITDQDFKLASEIDQMVGVG